MKRITAFLLTFLFCAGLLSGCKTTEAEPDTLTAACITYPVYLLACEVAEGSDAVTVVPVINESVACVHDYTLTVSDMKTLERADLILLNGAGLEDFMSDALLDKPQVTCSDGVELLPGEDGEADPHIWMDPSRAAVMAENIGEALAGLDPDHAELYRANADALSGELTVLAEESREALSGISRRELITFHEGFQYFADALDLTIVAAVEEESGSEASAKVLNEMAGLIREYDLSVIFTEQNGSTTSAEVLERECGVQVRSLSMLMSGSTEPDHPTYAELFRENIEVLKEALQ